MFVDSPYYSLTKEYSEQAIYGRRRLKLHDIRLNTLNSHQLMSILINEYKMICLYAFYNLYALVLLTAVLS